MGDKLIVREGDPCLKKLTNNPDFVITNLPFISVIFVDYKEIKNLTFEAFVFQSLSL